MRKDNTIERDMDLLKAYKEALSEAQFPFLLSDVIAETIKKPAKRFYCATRGVYECIKAIRRGEVVDFGSDEKERMVKDIHSIVKDLEPEREGTHLKEIVEEALDKPAPEFYLKKSSAIVILHHIQKQARINEFIKNKDRHDRMERRANRKNPLI
jgi:hypothetical protein